MGAARSRRCLQSRLGAGRSHALFRPAQAFDVPGRRADRVSHRRLHSGAGGRSRRARPVLPAAGRHHPEHDEHVLRRCAGAAFDLRAGHHALHLGVDHHAIGRRGGSHPGPAPQGRRVRPPPDRQVHPLLHRDPGHLPVDRHVGGAAGAGRGHKPRPHVRDDRGAHAHHRHRVPDVAGRADYRTRHRQRHFHDHPGQHPGRTAIGFRWHPAVGQHRRTERRLRADPDAADPGRDRLRGVRGARPAAAFRSTTPSACRAGACMPVSPATCRSSSTCPA